MPLKPHPTDEDKVVYVKPEYLIDGWKKPWVGLTDEDMNKLRHLVDWTVPLDIKKFARAIEAKLKEKNI